MTESLRSIAITATSSLLRIPPSLCLLSILSFLWRYHLNFSLSTKTVGSQVPCKSLYHVSVAFIPSTVWAVIRFPSDLSQRFRLVLVLIESFSLSIHQRLFTFVQLHDTHLTSLASLFLNAHYHVFCSQQLKVVWSQCLNTESEGPALIFYKAQNWFTPILSWHTAEYELLYINSSYNFSWKSFLEADKSAREFRCNHFCYKKSDTLIKDETGKY